MILLSKQLANGLWFDLVTRHSVPNRQLDELNLVLSWYTNASKEEEELKSFSSVCMYFPWIKFDAIKEELEQIPEDCLIVASMQSRLDSILKFDNESKSEISEFNNMRISIYKALGYLLCCLHIYGKFKWDIIRLTYEVLKASNPEEFQDKYFKEFKKMW